MIASCLERIRRDACGGCEREDACARMLRSLRFESRPRPRARANPPLMTIFGEIFRRIETGMSRPAGAFRRQVERRIEPLLASGPVRVERVARDLGCSRQTLYRRLKAEGTTFERIVEALRRRLALKFLREEGLSVKEAGYRLGFADPAAFSRAFKRWTGKSPGAVRRQPG